MSTDLKQTPRRRQTGERVDKLPPHSIEAEQATLGAIMISPDNLGECVEKFPAGKEVFYDIRHQIIYDVLVGMWERKENIDLITLQQELRDIGQLEAIGGFGYLASLPDMAGTAGHLGSYAQIIWEKYMLRKTIRTCSSVLDRVYEHEGDIDELLDEVETDVMRISEERSSRSQTNQRPIKSLVSDAIQSIETMHQNQGTIMGLQTGIKDLDRGTGGLQNGDMIVLAARPSAGKTSLAMQIAEFVAVDQKLPVGVFSLEMTAESLVQRMLCSRARVNLRSIRDGFLAERDFPRLTGSAGKISTAPLYIDDTSGLSIIQLKAKARRMKQERDIKLIVIDYLQLLHSTNRRAENRQQEIADISSGVKSIAKELHVPVIVLSQLNREMEKDKNRKPRLSDLRESGSIEQDADIVGLLYKPNRDDEDTPPSEGEEDMTQVNLLIAKQRNGPAGFDVQLNFFKCYTRFEGMARVAHDE